MKVKNSPNSLYSNQVQAQSDSPGEHTPHTASWVYLKVFKRKWSEPRWLGPYEVTERTTCALRLKGKGDTWYHWS
ncbi:hypothetical protein L3Q82_016465, partial [Scortum barcoo]